MTDRHINMRGHEVRRILDGWKTQHRLVLNPQPDDGGKAFMQLYQNGRAYSVVEKRHNHGDQMICLPCYAIGDRLWVREQHYLTDDGDCEQVVYAEDREDVAAHMAIIAEYEKTPWATKSWLARHGKLRRSIHMPRWASRLTLTVTDVRVQRVQEISEADAVAEGVDTGIWQDVADCVDWPLEPDSYPPDRTIYHAPGINDAPCYMVAADAFAHLWDSINAKRGHGWDANPWVVALTFTAEQRNIDEVA